MSVDCVEREDSNTWNQNWPSAGVGEHSVKINRNYSHFVKAFLVATSQTVLQHGRIVKTQIFTKCFRACWVPSVFSPLQIGMNQPRMASLLKRFFSRYGIMRPTKKVPFKKGKKVKKKDMPTWRTQDKWQMLFFVGYPIKVKGIVGFIGISIHGSGPKLDGMKQKNKRHSQLNKEQKVWFRLLSFLSSF